MAAAGAAGRDSRARGAVAGPAPRRLRPGGEDGLPLRRAQGTAAFAPSDTLYVEL